MKVGADPVAEDRATAIMWIVASLFVIPFMVGSGFGASWAVGMAYGYVTALAPTVIVVVGVIMGITAIARRQRSARYPRIGLLTGVGVCLVLLLVAGLINDGI